MPAKKEDNSSYRALRRALAEGVLGSLYIFHGEESYLREHALAQIKEALIPAGMESFNYHIMQAKGFDAAALLELTEALPVMSTRSLIVVRDVDLFKLAEETRRALAELFCALPEYCCLVFVYESIPYKSDARMKQLSAAIAEQAAVVDFRRQSQADLTDWIHRRFHALGRQIDSRDAQYLIFLCGDLMQGLIPEIEKIAAYAKGPRILRADIDALASQQLDAQVFQMTDALLRRNFSAAFELLDRLLRMQEPPIMILAVLGRQFRQALSAALLRARGKGTEDLMRLWGMRSAYPARKLMEAKLPEAFCRLAVLRAAECDLAMKYTTGADPAQLLLDLLLELSVWEERRAQD